MKTYRIIAALLLCGSMLPGLQAQTHTIEESQGKTTITTPQAEIIIEEADPAKFPPNEFTGSFRMTTELTNKKGQKEKPMLIDLYADTYAVCFEMTVEEKAGQKMRMIMDPTKATITTLIDDKAGKTGMISKMPKMTVKMKQNGKTVPEKATNVQVEATNEYKVLEGYNCRKYIIIDGSTVTESWITVDDAVSIHNLMTMFAASQKVKMEDPSKGFGGVRGMMLESTTVLASGERSHMTITNIVTGKVDESKFSTEGYQLIDMSQGFKGLFGQ